MKVGLFYFSGTGLTSELAKRIAAILHRKCAGRSGCVNLCPADAIYTALNYGRQPFTGMKDNIY